MREIKFRAWDVEEKIMIDANSFAFEEYLPLSDLFKSSSFEFMQFTGLRDKNGKEIYEGDIIKLGEDTYDLYYRINEKVTIEWDEDLTGFKPFMDTHSDYDYINNETCEVIGNIHETPELIKWDILNS